MVATVTAELVEAPSNFLGEAETGSCKPRECCGVCCLAAELTVPPLGTGGEGDRTDMLIGMAAEEEDVPPPVTRTLGAKTKACLGCTCC